MKKNYHLIGLFLLCLATAPSLMAQTILEGQTVTDLNKTPNYAFGVSDEEGLLGALGMYEILISNGVQVANFEVIVKGPVVKTMIKGSKLEKDLEKYQDKVQISICSIAMKRQGVSKDDLFLGLTVVETATIRMLQLQALGYNTIQ